MKRFSFDNFLVFVRGTVLHHWASLLLPLGLVVIGIEPSPVRLGSDLGSTRWLGFSTNMSWAMRCVVAAWVLSVNRTLNCRALNPSSTLSSARKDGMAGELVVITGEAGGVGAALAQKLDAAGAKVVVLDVATLAYQPANAGVVRGRSLLDTSDADLRLTFGVSVLDLLWTIRAFLPAMIAAGGPGHVLATLSATAFCTISRMSDYGASKAAAAFLIEDLRTELKHNHGNPPITFSTICPNTISTNMFNDLDSPDLFALPLLTPEDVADRMFDMLASGKSESAYLPAATVAQP